MAVISINWFINVEDKRPTIEGPNIVLIVSDDQRYDTLQSMPFLADLMSKGTTFTRGYVTTPLCCPSRSSILSGQYAHNHGVLSNTAPDGGFDQFNDSATLPVWLQDAGYQTGLFGKYLNGYSNEDVAYKPPGWDVFHAFVNEPGYFVFRLTRHRTDKYEGNTSYLNADKVYSTDLLALEAAAFIKEAAAEPEHPFFVMYTPYAPHGPVTPPTRYENETTGEENLPSYNEADVSDKSSWFETRPLLTEAEETRIQVTKDKTSGTLRGLDDGIQTIVQALNEAGVAENTVIIYIADNGFHWGEHRIPFGKSTPYEESVHVPLYLYDGRDQIGQTDNRLALNIDLAPTIAALAGIATPNNLDGRSLLDPQFERQHFLSENWQGQLSPFTAVHTGQMILISFKNGEQELYDLETDPYQLKNIINDPAYATQKTKLEAELELLRACQGDDCQQ